MQTNMSEQSHLHRPTFEFAVLERRRDEEDTIVVTAVTSDGIEEHRCSPLMKEALGKFANLMFEPTNDTQTGESV